MRCRWSLLTIASISFLASAGCAGRPPATPLDQITPPRPITVRPGDVVSIRFWGQPELSGERVVDNDGRIHLPLVRAVRVTGLAAEEIREELTRLYREFYADPLIVVSVRLGVNVTGAVRSPGRYTVDPAFTLFDLLGEAGGLQPDGNRKEIELIRSGTRYEVSLDEALIATEPAKLRLQSGDWVFVPRRFWTLQRVGTYASITVILLQIATIFAL